MSREEMMNEVIRTRGFEDKWTIWFCGLAESDLTDSGRSNYDDAENRVELGGYSLWDLGVGYHLTQQFKVDGRLANLLDKEYETTQGYPADGRSVYVSVNYQM